VSHTNYNQQLLRSRFPSVPVSVDKIASTDVVYLREGSNKAVDAECPARGATCFIS
jgi:hypothetical protein